MSSDTSCLPGVSLAYLAAMLGAKKANQLFRHVLSGTGPTRYVSYEDLWLVSNRHIHLIGDEGHALQKATIPVGTFELLASTLSQAETVGEGLKRVARASNLIGAALVIDVRRGGGSCTLSIHATKLAEPGKSLYLSLWVIVFHCLLCWLTRRDLPMARIRLPEGASPMAIQALRLLQCPVSFDAQDFSATYTLGDCAALLLPLDLRAWEAEVFVVYRRLVARTIAASGSNGERPLSERIRTELLSGTHRQSEICEALDLSPATLRRRLNSEGTSFRQIVDGYRKDFFERLVPGAGSLEQIAANVGYSDSRSLRRARKRWLSSRQSHT